VVQREDPIRPLIPGLVSTIIPVFNRAALLREAVDSVLAQTYEHFEILLVDDGSGEDTARFCDALAAAHTMLAVIHLPHDGRAGRAREAGRVRARGEYIQYLDSDDLISPRKFEVMIRALQSHPECDVAYCYTRRYRRGDVPIDVACERTGETFDRMLPECLGGRFWHTSTPLYTRRICDRAGPWSDLRYWEDVEYDLRIATLGTRVCHCKDFLTDFRDHDQGRLSMEDFLDDPESVRHAPSAYRVLCQYVRNSGVSPGAPPMQVFLAELRKIAARCAELGLRQEAQECLDLAAALLLTT
jgi:glycosyltransferase involved in cell wall biosynthesis